MNDPHTLSFEPFWAWLVTHPNCILRAGTPEAVIYDDEDLHWHFAAEGADILLVQVLRGKRVMGEILVAPDQIAYVQGVDGQEDGEYVFELIIESETERTVSYFFVLTHGFEEDEEGFTPGRVH